MGIHARLQSANFGSGRDSSLFIVVTYLLNYCQNQGRAQPLQNRRYPNLLERR
jgi:hypothetical protein